MTNLNRILFLVFLSCLGFLSCQSAFGYFTNQATSTNNTFTASSCFPTGSDMKINEVFSKGNQDKEWVELYNPTCSSVDISGWIIKDNHASDTLPSSSPIPIHGFGVIVAKNTSVTVPPSAITIQLSGDIGNGLNDNGDELYLKNGSTTINEMSYGTDTAVYPSPAPSAPTVAQSLQRNPDGKDTGSATDWHLATPTIGASNH